MHTFIIIKLQARGIRKTRHNSIQFICRIFINFLQLFTLITIYYTFIHNFNVLFKLLCVYLPGQSVDNISVRKQEAVPTSKTRGEKVAARNSGTSRLE